MPKRTLLLALLGILLLGGFFRFFRITEIPLGLYPDEAMNGNNALEALHTGEFKIFYPENNGREGLFINIQAVSVYLFGNEPWALRVVSALFGTLTILGIFFVARELFIRIENADNQHYKQFGNWKLEIENLQADLIGLLSAFFVATSYWHLNFSRIGFRAIMVPLLSSFAMYFLLRGLRVRRILPLILSGLCMGLGFYTYIAFRFMPFVVAVPLVYALVRHIKTKKNIPAEQQEKKSFFRPCTPCAVTLFLMATSIVALPIGLYFLKHPSHFSGRAPADTPITILASDSPLYEFTRSNLLTAQMFFFRGDCNWRHNYACEAQLHPIVAIFLIVGLLSGLLGILLSLHNFQFSIFNFQSNSNDQISKFGNWKLEIGNFHNTPPFITLLGWLIWMSLPATLTNEGLPHALRTIGMIPPVMIIAAYGAVHAAAIIRAMLEAIKKNTTRRAVQITRIQNEVIVLIGVLLIVIPLQTYRDYFIKWAYHAKAYSAFSADFVHIGKFLNAVTPDVTTYVIANVSGVDVRGLPTSAQTVMYLTDTFREEERFRKRITYIRPEQIDTIKIEGQLPSLIVFLNGHDRELVNDTRAKFLNMKPSAPSDFVVLKNF